MGFLDKLFKRETSAERAAWLDQAVSGAAAQAQQHFLAEIRTARRSFEAAETPAWTDSWPTNAAPINDDLARQLPTLRARARGMARNNEWAIGYLLQLDDQVLGESGMRLQMRLKHRDGTPDTTNNNRIEAGFTRWSSAADVSGLSWREVESLALKSMIVDGELLYRMRPLAGQFKFQIQMLDPSLLDVSLHREWQGRRVRMGVEITDDGAPVAYWLLMNKTGDAPSELVSVGRHIRVPATQIRHRFIRHEVGQLRGYPELSGGARRLWMLHDFEESAAVASSNAAKRQGFFVSPDGEAPRGFADTIISGVLESAKASGKVLTTDEVQAITAAAEKYATTLPGQYDTLPVGYDFRPYESKWPTIESGSYVKQQLRGWSAARGMSYVSLGNDLESVNYSSARVGIVSEREHFKAMQGMLRAWLHDEIITAALPGIVLATPGLDMSRVANYLAAVSWQPRRWAGIDPVKEANANETNLRLKLTSRRRLILERGEDPDEVFAEIDAEEEIFGLIDAAAPQDVPAEDDAGDDAGDTTDPADQDEEVDPKTANKTIRRAPLVAVREHAHPMRRHSSGSYVAPSNGD
ncbi:MAG: phage portal protein [Gammaproteobacteria bacterium]|nr:phage portal protein [Rhodocyclaceae bacterium]MBU3908876.1 phage portal protein [Gammaproteobacteria bacterium]MBU3987743.1 phage portal protein [Gammaproteobacteria bacterium]MBU4003354.1 phage portal protein [Gammaproteobacteria bacterium]MBU4021825.1 phage portal protein [Gammaproteobacteria bacterium]